MTILFDQGTPAPLRRHSAGHVVVTAAEAGLGTLENGDLIRAADGVFDLLLTTDQSVRYQQNLGGRQIAILVLLVGRWETVRQHAPAVAAAVNAMRAGEDRELDLPRRPRRP